jgi:hypothetical protein
MRATRDFYNERASALAALAEQSKCQDQQSDLLDLARAWRDLAEGLSLHTLRARRSGFLLLRPATSFNKGFIMSPSDESDVDIGQLRIILFGSQFAAVDDAEATGISASGPGCLQMLALRLMASGYPPEQSLSLYRNGQHIGKTTLSTAAKRST